MRLLQLKPDGELSLTRDLINDFPHYAILSHTWGPDTDEVTLGDLLDKTGKRKIGYDKIRFCGEQARRSGMEYFWVDTCCIDKSNSTELAEAINSMYNWYREAQICFAYLADVTPNDDPYTSSSFAESRWFTRGWTLQELIGPSEVIFFASDWTRIGTKHELSSVISEITGIPERFLLGDDLAEASVAQRMSWAAKRNTTKVEDIAYCLLGIFDIRMPLIYGERERAFRRLQEEVIKVSDDQSVFAWIVDSDANTTIVKDGIGLLARSPASFKRSGNIIRASAPRGDGYLLGVRTPFAINNKGLHLALPLFQAGEEMEFLAVLSCRDTATTSEHRTALWLVDISTNGGRYMRVKSDRLEHINADLIRNLKYQAICAQFENLRDRREAGASAAGGSARPERVAYPRKSLYVLVLRALIGLVFGLGFLLTVISIWRIRNGTLSSQVFNIAIGVMCTIIALIFLLSPPRSSMHLPRSGIV
jgi:hypothetical protein